MTSTPHILGADGTPTSARSHDASSSRRLPRTAFDAAVLMDVRMPDMNDFQTAAAIRARAEISGERVPILALSAHAERGYRDRCYSAGMDGHVTKPVQLAQRFAPIDELAPAPAMP